MVSFGKEMYQMIPNTIGGGTPYACTGGNEVVSTTWCQITSKEEAEKKCDSLSDCAGYSVFKGDPKKWGGGKAKAQLIGMKQLVEQPNKEWDFYKKGAPVKTTTGTAATKSVTLTKDQLDKLVQGQQIILS
jgi:hypothetical protein